MKVGIIGRRRVFGFALGLALFSSAAPSAEAQFLFTSVTTAPSNVNGWQFTGVLFPIPDLVDPLSGFDTQGRMAVGDLDRDNRPEVIFTFPTLAGLGELFVYTFDPVSGTYERRPDIVFASDVDGRLFTGDVDGDGDDEIMLAEFGNATPAPRPATGGSSSIHVIDVSDLAAGDFTHFEIRNQFITRHSQFVARDTNGDGAAEILMLSQDESGKTSSNEPAGAASLFICAPVLATPASCTDLGGGTIPAGPGGRYPTSIDGGDIDDDGVFEALIGYGTACEDDANLLVIGFGEPAEGPFTLNSSFQRLALGDIDGDGGHELVVAAGGTPTSTGAVQIYRFDPATPGFDLVTAAAAALPVNSCSPPTDLTPTQEPGAKVEFSLPKEGLGDPCNGMDDDDDGETDENCLLRFLFMPMCFDGNDDDFRALTSESIDFFKQSLDLDGCGGETVFVDWVSQADYEIAPDCDPGYFMGNFAFDIQQGTNLLGIDPNAWTVIIAFSNREDFPADDDNPAAGLTFGTDDGVMFVKHLPDVLIGTETGNRYHILPESTFSHEFGHLLALDEEYEFNPNAVNPLEARLGCNPDDDSCCYFDSEGECAALNGNRTRFGNGRCIMSFVNAETTVSDAPPIPRAWCENCFRHITQAPPVRFNLAAPLTCATAYDGNGPIIFLDGVVGRTGVIGNLSSTFVERGRPAMGGSFTGDLAFRVEDATGAAFYETRFPRAPRRTLIVPEGGLGPAPVFETMPLSVRVPLPPGVAPTDRLAVAVADNGTDVTRVTLNGSPPVAVAGADRTVECSQSNAAELTLDGSGSSDPDGDILQFSWTSSGGSFDDATIAMPRYTAPLGTSTVTLEVSDGMATASDSLSVTVRDTTPPSLTDPADRDATICGGSDATTLTVPVAGDACDPNPVVTGRVTRTNNRNVNIPISSAGLVTLGPGVHTVVWTATDQSGNQKNVEQTITVRPAVHARGSLILPDRARVTAGNSFALLGNSGTEIVELGVEARSGSVFARGNVFLRNFATVHGSVTASGSITNQTGATITGERRPNTDPGLPAPLPLSVGFPPPSGDVQVFPGNTATRPPGSYGRVTVFSSATLRLTAGSYYFERLILEPSSTLELDESAGAIELFVKSELIHRGRFLTPSSAGVSLAYTGPSTAWLEAPFQGLIRAPNARVVLRKNYTGSLTARHIELSPDVVLSCKTDTSGAPGVQFSRPFEPAASHETAVDQPAGCACRSAPAPGSSGRWAALSLLLLGAVLRRRARASAVPVKRVAFE